MLTKEFIEETYYRNLLFGVGIQDVVVENYEFTLKDNKVLLKKVLYWNASLGDVLIVPEFVSYISTTFLCKCQKVELIKKVVANNVIKFINSSDRGLLLDEFDSVFPDNVKSIILPKLEVIDTGLFHGELQELVLNKTLDKVEPYGFEFVTLKYGLDFDYIRVIRYAGFRGLHVPYLHVKEVDRLNYKVLTEKETDVCFKIDKVNHYFKDGQWYDMKDSSDWEKEIQGLEGS